MASDKAEEYDKTKAAKNQDKNNTKKAEISKNKNKKKSMFEELLEKEVEKDPNAT
jgi:hypothetical protein